MARKRYAAEEIIGHLRTLEIATGRGLGLAEACRKLGITEQPFYRWKKEYGGLRIDQGKRLKSLEQENARLKRLVADLSLDKRLLKEVAAGHFSARPDAERRYAMHRTLSRSLNAGPVESWANAGPRSSMCRADWKMKSRCARGVLRSLVPMDAMGTGEARPCFSRKGGASTTSEWNGFGARRA